MSHLNSIALSGKVVRDPEVRTTAGGTDLCKLRVVSNRSRKVGDEYQEESTFVDVTCFSGLAGLVGRKVRKGDDVAVLGRLSTSEWEAQDGTKRYGFEIVANEIDTQAFFRKDGEVPALQPSEGGAQASAAPAAASTTQLAADDDIPF